MRHAISLSHALSLTSNLHLLTCTDLHLHPETDTYTSSRSGTCQNTTFRLQGMYKLKLTLLLLPSNKASPKLNHGEVGGKLKKKADTLCGSLTSFYQSTLEVQCVRASGGLTCKAPRVDGRSCGKRARNYKSSGSLPKIWGPCGCSEPGKMRSMRACFLRSLLFGSMPHTARRSTSSGLRSNCSAAVR